MMIASIKKGKACGKISAPPSKSMAHRLLICAGLSDGISKIHNISLSQDILATLDCLSALGAEYTVSGDCIEIKGANPCLAHIGAANCRESGSTLRFFIPIFWLSKFNTELSGSEYLFKRPLEPFKRIAENENLVFDLEKDTLSLKGVISGGNYEIKGNISSQFISGLLFALPLANRDSTIKIIPPLESRSYIDMTIDALKSFNISATWIDDFTIFIKSNQRYRPCEITVEGDYSNAAFFAALNSLGGNVEITGLKKDSLQGDKIIFEYLKHLEEDNAVIDVSDCPDIAPILITVAAAKNGGKFTGTKRLEIKESNRGKVIAEELKKFGAEVCVFDNHITVEKNKLFAPKEILLGHNDHRIVMSLAILLTLFSGEISGCEAINKSFPDFFKALSSLCIEVKLYEDK